MLSFEMLPDCSFWNNGKVSGNTPPRYASASLADFELGRYRKTGEVLERYVRNFLVEDQVDRDLIISAPEGAGKTHLGISIAKAMAHKKTRTLYLPAVDYLRTMFAEPQLADDFLELILSYDCLVLDDFGQKAQDVDEEVARVAMFRLIDGRYTNCQTTIVLTAQRTSVLHSEGFGLNRRIVDRLRGSVIEFGWGA